jgi:hypothetical protein
VRTSNAKALSIGPRRCSRRASSFTSS